MSEPCSTEKSVKLEVSLESNISCQLLHRNGEKHSKDQHYAASVMKLHPIKKNTITFSTILVFIKDKPVDSRSVKFNTAFVPPKV